MMQFNYDTSTLLNQLILALVTALLPLQLWLLLFRNRTVFSGRLAVKTGINVLLWLSVLGFVLQPYWQTKSISLAGLIIGKDVPNDFQKYLKDSLKTAERLNFASLKDLSALNRFDTLILAGQDFEPGIFQTLSKSERQPAIKWVPYTISNQLKSLSWKGVLRKGEMQTVSGSMKCESKKLLRIRFGNQTLDSTELPAGEHVFQLKFPVFTEGRTSVELALEDKILDTLRFFARPAEPLTVQFLLDNPDFESRTLATWLGKNGHSVLYSAKLSKDIIGKVTINKAKEADLIITGPSNASQSVVKKAVTNGKSVLFFGLGDVPADVQQVDNALKTRFQVKKISAETEVPVSTGLAASPYQFAHSNAQIKVDGFPVSVEKTEGKIGISLLNEIFPLMLNGDSVLYGKVWNAVLAGVRPVSGSNIQIQSPVYRDLGTTISLNNFPDSPKFLKAGKDTLFLDYSTINNLSAHSNFAPTESGWIGLSDSTGTEFFVEDPDFGPLARIFKMREYVRSYDGILARKSEVFSRGPALDQTVKREFSDWIWFGVVLICLAAVWIEGKL